MKNIPLINRIFLPFLLLLLLMLSPSLAENQDITVTFLGDCTIGSEDYLRERDTSFDSALNLNGYSWFFEKVRPWVGTDDLTVANLEGVFSDSSAGRVKKTYNFRAPSSFTRVLTESGIESVNLANNHTFDYGKRGLEDTVAALDSAGVGWFCSSDSLLRTWIFEKNNIRIGFLGMEIRYWGNNQQVIQDQVKSLKDAGCQVVVGIYHGGGEYSQHRDISQEKIARRLISYGCSAVLGHHPHVLQGVDVVDGATVCYSLGNFVFGGNAKIKTPKALLTALFQITFTFDEAGNYLGQRLNIIPAHTSSDSVNNTFQPQPVTGAEADEVMAQIQQDTSFPLEPFQEGIGALQPWLPAPSQQSPSY